MSADLEVAPAPASPPDATPREDPACTWIDDELGEECGEAGTVFAVGSARVVPDGRLGSVIRRDRSPLAFACPAHVVAALVAGEDPTVCSVVIPVAEHPLRGRPASS